MTTELTNPERIVSVDGGITRFAIARHYQGIAGLMVPHLRGRPLMVVRCPDDREADRLHPPPAGKLEPQAIDMPWVDELTRPNRCLVVDDAAGLREAVRYGAIELHVWSSRRGHLEQPDRVVFDLDPGPGVAFEAVRRAARDVRAYLLHSRLVSFVMTTGGSGLHVVAPLQPAADFDTVAAFARDLASEMARRDPESYVDHAGKHERAGKVLVEHARNGRGATAICPYSLRRHRGAPVATPLRWEELSSIDDSRLYRYANVFRRLGQLETEPWDGYFDVVQSLR